MARHLFASAPLSGARKDILRNKLVTSVRLSFHVEFFPTNRRDLSDSYVVRGIASQRK